MPLINPYSPGSDEYVDFEIWKNGVECFNDPARQYSKRTRKPHELDYLRGFHDPATLDAIKARLAAVTGELVNVTSFWLDKTAYVFPTTPGVSRNKRELADLAVVLHDHSRDHHAMWILQAKKSDNAADPLPKDNSTQKEIELFEKSPQFELEQLPKGKTKLAFDLEPEFGSPTDSATFRHWSFLMFRETPTVPPTGLSSPAQWRWTGSDTNPLTGSFMKGITEMLIHPSNLNHKGAILLQSNVSGWKNLHDALMSHVPDTTILGHARRPMRISTFLTNELHFGWIESYDQRLARVVNRVFQFHPPELKFDMIATGYGANEELQNWRERISNTHFWKWTEKFISESVDRAIKSEDSSYPPQRDDDTAFIGGGGRPPGNNSSGEDGNGAHPTRATLIIEIGKLRN